MTEQYTYNLQIMTNTRIILIWYWWFLLCIQNIYSNLIQNEFMSFCNQTLNMSSPLSIIFTPNSVSYSSCCNITLLQPILSKSSEQIIINILNVSQTNPSLQIFHEKILSFSLINQSLFNQTYIQSNIINLPLKFSLCQFNIQSFEILITNITSISKGSCLSNQYLCSANKQQEWCIDEIYRCDNHSACPQGLHELACPKTNSRMTLAKMKRTIRGGIVTTIIVLGLLLIIGSVSIAIAFVYFQRKRQRRRQFTYSLESTSDDWEPTGTGYHLFDNWTSNRRSTNNHLDNVINDSNEHVPITTTPAHR